ncbi:MAG TPA: hypothetical protein VFK79_18045 [Xanthobacteraceae bacterium]|nr:hypothetical protein [Xanthobacteraceae bacterium]
MLAQIGAALAVVLLTAPAFAQTFERPFDPTTRRNVQPQHRPAPAKNYSTTTAKPSSNPYAGQIGVPAPPSAYTGTYSSKTYGSTYGPGNR